MKVLVTGATGYVGGRLVEQLLQKDHEVTVLVRDSDRASGRSWLSAVKVIEADLLVEESLEGFLDDIDVAYYLVHSMYSDESFAAKDRQAATNFIARAGKLKHVVYLGGILPESLSEEVQSEHLRSRAEIGEILRSNCPTTEFRAGPVIGGGSASFEMVRYLTERLPMMIAPKWILNKVRPISIRDALAYLLGALDFPKPLGVVDIGTQPLTFLQMMRQYAEVRGLPRVIVPVPVLAPRLAALWVGLVTPISNRLAVPLIEGIVQSVVGNTDKACSLFPEIAPLSYRESVSRALERTDAGELETRWSVAGGSAAKAVRLEDREGLVREVRTRLIEAKSEDVFLAFSSLGGTKGWLVWEWAWRLRGLVDQFLGGPGLRRGRRDTVRLFPGEALDFWRVEEYRAPFVLRLRAEMKVPGKAWLQFEAVPEGKMTRLIQTAYFAPTGFLGWLYWYGVYPLHSRIFSDLVDAIAMEAISPKNS
tara:strand:- start:1129 stop:2562 length:1434 start_codon:yes stop_codon:yes gene_type:complete